MPEQRIGEEPGELVEAHERAAGEPVVDVVALERREQAEHRAVAEDGEQDDGRQRHDHQGAVAF
jgi:hypothetical protein